MNHSVASTQSKGSATVERNDKGIIVCVLRGFIDGPVVRQSLEETKVYADQLIRQKRPVYLLIDATAVTGQTSSARSLAKTLGSIGLTRLAICNRNRMLGLLIQYMVRASGLSIQTRIFHERRQAIDWLLHNSRRGAVRQDSRLRLGVAILVALIATGALIGWSINSDILKEFVPGFRPMNPIAALTILALSVSLVCLRQAGTLSPRRTKIVAVIAILTTLFGLGVFLQNILGVNLHVDDWLFTDRLNLGQISGRAAPRTGFLLALIGIMEIAILTGQRKAWQKYVFHAASVVVFAGAFLSILGYAFGVPGLYNLAGQLPMPLDNAICFLFINYALQTARRPLSAFGWSWNVFTKYRLPIIVTLVTILLAGIAWQQSNRDIARTHLTASKDEFSRTSSVLQGRMNAYINTLRGYRSFFEASENVTVDEYGEFFDSSKLAQNYPGFSAITFARNISANQRQAFEVTTRRQNTISSTTPFSIFPKGDRAVYYPILYVEPHTPITTYGFDLGSDPTRRAALEKARDTDGVVMTGAIDLNASHADSKLPKRPGFFITIPVYKNSSSSLPQTLTERRQTIYGFVNTVFEDTILFKDVFKSVSPANVQYVLTNAHSGDALYSYGNYKVKTAKLEPVYASTFTITDQTWRLEMYATPTFGVPVAEQLVSPAVLVGGFIMAALAGIFTTTQIRRREEALSLASAMTEDLNNERDAAITIQKKDEAILSSIGDAVFAIDKTNKIILFNRTAANLSNIHEAQALGQPYDHIFRFRREKNGVPVSNFIASALSGKPSQMAAGTLLERPDGTTIPVADSAAPIINAQGDVEGAVVVFRDITHERELEKLKDDFVAVASHELRTPMGAIRAFSSMILAGDYGPVNKSLVEPLTDIKNSTLRLVNLVNDMLDMARIEAGRMKFELTDFDLAEVLRETVATLTPLAKEKSLDLSLVMPKHSLPVQADIDKTKQVLTNLIGNALKFTPKGSIVVAANIDKNVVEVRITDSGIGIAEADQSQLFGKFQQISSHEQGHAPGTGLGLYVSREIVRKMGGDLYLKSSSPDKGSTFAFTLLRSNSEQAKKVRQRIHREAKAHSDQK